MTTVFTTNVVTDRDAYLPLAKAFAEDVIANDKGCHGMQVFVNPEAKDEVYNKLHSCCNYERIK